MWLRQLARRLLAGWWDGRVHLAALDLAVAAALLAFEFSSHRTAQHNPWYPVAVTALSLALVVRRRFPFVLLVVAVVGGAAGLTLLPVTVGLYSVAARFGMSLPTLFAGLVVCGVAAELHFRSGGFDLMGAVLQLTLFLIAPGLAGLWMWQRAELLKVLRDRAEEAERTRTLLAEQAVEAERRRIAREMHDVVAHRVTAIALQAGALSVQAPDERTERTAETIRQVSVTALDELRGILTVLRENTGEDQQRARLAGAGMLASVADLVAEATESGARIERVVLPDPLPEVPAPVGRAAYRVVQEALTNAGKHAPNTPITIEITATAAELRVQVSNPLSPHRAELPGSGYGLIGMRERVELAGGELTTGPVHGDFRVLASFSLRRPELEEA